MNDEMNEERQLKQARDTIDNIIIISMVILIYGYGCVNLIEYKLD